jgi:hypothetical protein
MNSIRSSAWSLVIPKGSVLGVGKSTSSAGNITFRMYSDLWQTILLWTFHTSPFATT